MIKTRALPWTGTRWPFRRSLSTQLVLWNTVMLALLLCVLGGILRYAVKRTIMASVERQLDMQTRPHNDAPPPPDGRGDLGLRRDGGPQGDNGFHDGGGPQGDPGPRPEGAPPNGNPSYDGGPQGGGAPHGDGGPQGGAPHSDGPQGDNASRGDSGPQGDRSPGGVPFAIGGGSKLPDGPGFGPGGPQPPFMMRFNMTHAKRKPYDDFFPRMIGLDGRSHDPFGSVPLLDRSAFLSSKSGKTIYATVTVAGQQARIISRPIVFNGHVMGVIQAGYPLAGINRALLGLDRVLLIFIPIALLCAAFAGTTLTARVLSRVRGMTHAAARIGSQDFSERIPVVGHDEFSELADTFNGLLGRLQNAIDQQRRFTADASHELKSPLTIIQGNTGIALGDLSDTEGCREALLEIDRATETMSVLVRDLLLLARSDAGRLGQQPIELLIGEVVERALASARRERSACVTVSIPDETLSVRGNEEELIRLFANLLNNARQHTPPDGRITVTAHRDGDSVLVTIEDTGIGIAAEHLPHLGERFYRVDSARARADGGTGLGLSICKSIAAAHGGELSIASAPGEGTTVTVRLPAVD